MKPPPFTYIAPTSLEEALAALAEHGDEAKVLAGGQSLVPLMSLRLAHPTALIDLNGVGGLAAMDAVDGTVAVGAMVRERAAERSALISSSAPLLAAALPLIGHAAIRTRGTIGGSIAHADPAAELPAVALGLDAEVEATSAARGERTIPAAEFFQGFFTTALEPDEIVTQIRFPAEPAGTGAAFEEACRRHGDFAMVGVGAQVRMDSGRIADARLVMIGVSDVPVRARAAESLLVGAAPADDIFNEAGQAAFKDLEPPSDLHASAAYRRHVGAVLVRRALHGAVAQAQGPSGPSSGSSKENQ